MGSAKSGQGMHFDPAQGRSLSETWQPRRHEALVTTARKPLACPMCRSVERVGCWCVRC